MKYLLVAAAIALVGCGSTQEELRALAQGSPRATPTPSAVVTLIPPIEETPATRVQVAPAVVSTPAPTPTPAPIPTYFAFVKWSGGYGGAGADITPAIPNAAAGHCSAQEWYGGVFRGNGTIAKILNGGTRFIFDFPSLAGEPKPGVAQRFSVTCVWNVTSPATTRTVTYANGVYP